MSPRIRLNPVNALFTTTLLAVMTCHVQFLSAQQAPTRAVVRLLSEPDLVSSEQLRQHPDLPTAYTVISALHSNWMVERGVRPISATRLPDGWRAVAGENGGVQVYLDGHRMGGVELLRNIPVVGVYSIRHINGVEAQARYGAGHSEGIIWIATSPAWERAW